MGKCDLYHNFLNLRQLHRLSQGAIVALLKDLGKHEAGTASSDGLDGWNLYRDQFPEFAEHLFLQE